MSYAPSPFTPLGIRSIQQQRDRWERKRSCTARELVQSEQRYCEQLDLVVTVSLSLYRPNITQSTPMGWIGRSCIKQYTDGESVVRAGFSHRNRKICLLRCVYHQNILIKYKSEILIIFESFIHCFNGTRFSIHWVVLDTITGLFFWNS